MSLAKPVPSQGHPPPKTRAGGGVASIVTVRQRSDPQRQVWLLREQPEQCTVFSGQPAANDCLGALLATTLGFWYFMFNPFEAVASFVASPPSPAPADIQRQNGLLTARSALVSLCRAVGAPHSRRRRAAPDALATDSVPMDAIRSVWTSLPVRTRPAPIAMVFVGPVLVRRVRPVGASASVRTRSAVSASAFHHLLLSPLFRGRTPCPRRPSLQYSRPSRKSFTSPDIKWQRQTFTFFRSISAPSGGWPKRGDTRKHRFRPVPRQAKMHYYSV